MANPLMGMINNSATANPAIGAQNNLIQAAQSAKRMMNMLQSVKNPQQALMAAVQQNPQINAVMQMIGNRNPKEVFYEQCKKQGIDPDTIINALK